MNTDAQPAIRAYSPERTRKEYRRVAAFYDLWARLTESRAMQQVVEYAAIKNGDSVLEVAVGTGNFFSDLVRADPDGRVIGVDLSPAMIAQARMKVQPVASDNSCLCIAEAHHLPVASESIDVLVNNFMIDLLPEEAFVPVLLEFKRTLKVSGRLVVSTMAYGERIYNGIWSWLAENVPALLTGCRPLRLGAYLEQSGFVVLDSTAISQNTFPSEVTVARKG